ncbi:MAG: leucyl/phenylalanyl-tRNA--protein transferase [Gammaproteobacteria bacterium]|nr:leucyl/phenylalanyl-tRNA--protein transferase [Gammaproteobacteria bacterium]
MVPWLEATAKPYFPDTASVLAEPAGLLAAGGRLDVEWLLVAYRQGIFPWFSESEPILWWCPAPRTVLYPKRFYQSKSLQKLARQQRYQITLDQDFEAVIEACAADREGQSGTWINSQMIDAYIEMHHAGFAHSIECRHQDELVGGLYGIGLGKIFFGESMFSRAANASKLCLKHLVDSGNYEMIDCQLPTGHLHSLGAIEISRDEFESALNRWI